YHCERLVRLVSIVTKSNYFWQSRFEEAGINPATIQSKSDLSKLPLTSKSDFIEDQQRHPPYGRNLSQPFDWHVRLHQTSGTTTGRPLRWLDSHRSWEWMLDCWKHFFRWMNVEPTDRFCFPFSFGPFLGFWAGFEGALRSGCFCVAAGGMSSEARLNLILENKITFLGCTPTYALRLAEVASVLGIDLASSSVRAILVAGEPGGSIGPIRSRIEFAWGARVFDHWGMTEIGPLANEYADDPGNLTVLESECIAEIIDPETTKPVQPGQPGELVITNLGRLDSPVIRYRTGDLVVAATDSHPSNRTLLRLKGGILGRIDDMLIIRGNNLFPSSLEAIIREFPEVIEYRIIHSKRREM
ncbi:MAG: phenylacetate--CoA ligase, partial [Planctomycetes bacterium]|nr:phenylacetate--CoA ligase [Planctomycetota bacterium]